MLDTEQADVVSPFKKYEYASLPHVTLLLLWHTMMRRVQHMRLTWRTTTRTSNFSR